MYGLINRALERMVVETHGRSTWDAIRREAGVADELFVTMKQYPDGMTYTLVAAASNQLGTPADKLLRGFGEYWVRVVAPAGYGPLMDLAGASFPEFLRNLDVLHERVALAFTNLRQPSFDVEDLGPGHMLVHYRSDRPGLAPFVEGLLTGLGARFSTPVRVAPHTRRGEGADHDIFEVWYG